MRVMGLFILMLVMGGAGANPAPEQVIRQQAAMLLEGLAAAQPGDASEDLVLDIIGPHVDFALFSKLVLGKHWRALSDAQQTRFVEGMMRLVVKTYTAALTGAAGLNIEYLGTQTDPRSGRVTVATLATSSGHAPVRIDYKLYETEGAWKVYDVAIEGVSMALNYRSVLADRIHSEGIDAVIGSLSKPPGKMVAK